MAKIITSDSVVFMDNTDNRKLDVYITSNLPTVQIKNSNTSPVTYTPNWASTPLVLEADAYLDAEDVTSKTTFYWYKKGVNGVEVPISTSTNNQIIINSNNDLDNNQLMVYICKAIYKASDADGGIEDTEQLTFSQVSAGINGTSGTSAPAVQAQYSADGTTGWTSTLDPSTHKYIRHSYDGGKTYTVAMKMVGEDGTSVAIKGTAYTSDQLVAGQVVRLYSDANKTISVSTADLSSGDSYLVDGYLCVYNKTNNNFVCTGTIQGPQGVPGQSAYVYIRYATNASGENMSSTPSSSTTYIGVCVSTNSSAPTMPSLYTWSKFVGDSAKSIRLNGSSQVFKVTKGDTETYEPTTILVSAQAVNTSVAKWEYSTDGGLGWVTFTSSSAPDWMTFDSAKNTVALVGKDLISNTLVIRASNGEYKDVYTIYKVLDGADGAAGAKGTDAPIAFLTNENISIAANANGVVNNTTTLRIVTSVASYIGTTKQMPILGEIIDKPSDMNIEIGENLMQEKTLTISFKDGATLGSASSNSGTVTIPITYPVVTNLKLSWSKINTGAKGDKGDQGVQGVKGENGQQLYTWVKYADTPTSGMSDNPSGKTYIGLAYNKTTATESSIYTDYMWSLIKGETGPTGPKGADGQQYYTWVKYADDASGSNMSDSPDGKLYIGLAYNKTTSTESNIATEYAWALFKGEDGAIGAPGANAVTFQIYSSNGYALSTNTPSVTLQTFAYIGDIEITAGATYQWYEYGTNDWTAISGATNPYLTVGREEVAFSKNYKCVMTFNDVQYVGVVTLDDKNDENKVFTSKPSDYAAGDIWVVGVDYAPAGVEVGTLLRAEHTNATYEDADWVTSLKYDDKISALENNIKTYNQYFSFDSAEGLKISAKDDNGTPSQFSTSLTNERLSFNYGNEAIAYINGTKMNIKEAEIESPLTVTGKYSGSTMLQAPVINIGNFSIIVESNGSLSIVANS